jgi:hypothetical protein
VRRGRQALLALSLLSCLALDVVTVWALCRWIVQPELDRFGVFAVALGLACLQTLGTQERVK